MESLRCAIKNDPARSCFSITGIGQDMCIEYSTDVNFTPFVHCLAGLIENDRTIEIVDPLDLEGKAKVVYEALVSIIEKFNCAISGGLTSEAESFLV